ncbi:MAG TPA: DUF4136 domain-containing protein [Parachlamydiaceae bacterium]|nr:DUF4136 domain-containing protein [Parachlamydiaceae bacterium]
MQLNPHGHTLVPQDCWNQIVSYKTNFADLKTWRLVSSSMPQTIELCCQNILKELDLNDEDSPALAEDRIHVISFKRILSLEDLIQRWTKRKESEDDDFLQDPSQLDSSALQDLVSKKFKQLNFPLHSLKDFFEMIHCMLNYSKKVVTVTAVIYYFTSSIFKGHPGNEDLKKIHYQKFIRFINCN